ncbi:hydroxypyruvate isomerase [bacterium A37T11]|nr:hydroxypyruvate isomerase [bacterium A37T11]
MNRSDFIKGTVLAAGSVAIGTTAKGFATNFAPVADQPFHLNYGPHQGMFSNHAGKSFLDEIQFIYDRGFRGIEDNGMAGRPEQEQEQIGNLLAKLNMAMGVFVLDKGGNGANTLAAGKPEYVDIFLKGCRQAVEVSKRCGGKLATVVPGDFARDIPVDIQTAHVIEALRRGMEILEPHGIVIVLEPLSDTPNLFLRTAEQTYLICKGVNSPSCKILYDFYHMQRNRGDLIATMDKCWEEIGYFQIGDNPGRKEPTTGEINYKNIFKHLYEKGYKGVVGMEHGKSIEGKEGELRLIGAYREVDDFLARNK